MPNKQPVYHDIQCAPWRASSNLHAEIIIEAFKKIVPKAQHDSIEVFGDQILFTAYRDRSNDAKRVAEKLGLTGVVVEWEAGDPADLM